MIICVGEALIDMIRAPVPGSSSSSSVKEAFIPLPGGSPYNTAIAIGRMKVPVKFFGKFSTDFFGDILLKRLRDNNVGDELVIRSKNNSTLAFVKLEKGKEPQYIFYTEGTADRSLEIADLPSKLPGETKCILFGSIAMTMEPLASAIDALILREATRKNADQMDGAPIISFDPNIRQFMIKDRNAFIARFEKWVAASTIAKISAADFEYLYPKIDAEKALHKILAMGPRLAICTMGQKGALALLRRNDGTITKVKAPAVNLPVVDTIGAGDTFHGAFLSWLVIKEKMSRSSLANLGESDLYDALVFANKAASVVCSRRGAEPPTLRELKNLKNPGLRSPGDKSPRAKAKTVKKAAGKTAKAPANTKKKPPPAAKKKKTTKKKVSLTKAQIKRN